MKRILMVVSTVLALATTAAPAAGPGRFGSTEQESERTFSRPTGPGGGIPVVGQEIGLRYRIKASRPRLNRRLTGPVRRWRGGLRP